MKFRNLCKVFVLLLLASQAANASRIGIFPELGIPSFSKAEPSYLHLSEVSSSIEQMEQKKKDLYEHRNARCSMGDPNCLRNGIN